MLIVLPGVSTSFPLPPFGLPPAPQSVLHTASAWPAPPPIAAAHHMCVPLQTKAQLQFQYEERFKDVMEMWAGATDDVREITQEALKKQLRSCHRSSLFSSEPAHRVRPAGARVAPSQGTQWVPDPLWGFSCSAPSGHGGWTRGK